MLVSSIANWHPLISGPPYRASFYRERKVSKEEFYQALDDQLAIYNVSDQAIGDICYGSDRNSSVTNLLLFLEGGRTWPVGDKYECPTRPPKSNYCWTQVGVDGGSGYFPGIQVGDLVTGQIFSDHTFLSSRFEPISDAINTLFYLFFLLHNCPVNLHPLFLFWKHGSFYDPGKKSGPKYGVQKTGSLNTGTLGLKFSHFYIKTAPGLSWMSNDR